MNKRKKGTQQEERAAEYLKKKGYKILAMNYRCRYGELDIVAYRGNLLVIAEVKYRNTERCGDPAEAVDAHKQSKICRVTMDYLMRHPYFQGKPCRFDVIAIYGDGEIRHIQNAFDFHG
ncbi:MAG: YraN family protein [Lachnospiraceae bacterium]|nr:YraN family protein [Lachnospiraceae bacterium]